MCRIGVLWIQNPRIEVFEYLLKKKGLDGPGLDIMVPFLGKSYVTCGILGPDHAQVNVVTESEL